MYELYHKLFFKLSVVINVADTIMTTDKKSQTVLKFWF